jgi:hypothetical protein
LNVGLELAKVAESKDAAAQSGREARMVDEATASASKDVEEDLLAQTAKVRLLAG